MGGCYRYEPFTTTILNLKENEFDYVACSVYMTKMRESAQKIGDSIEAVITNILDLDEDLEVILQK